MKRDGPSFITWLLGRVAHPPSSAACTDCGEPGGDEEAAARLHDAGLHAVAKLAALCERCRRGRRDAALRGNAAGRARTER